MKFKSQSANLIVWDPQTNKTLCRFKDFELETEDEYIIDRLGDYEVMDDGRETEQGDAKGQEGKKQQVEDLRQEAKEKGIKNWHNMKPENLKKKLRGD